MNGGRAGPVHGTRVVGGGRHVEQPAALPHPRREVVATDGASQAVVTTPSGAVLGFGRVEGHQPPTWPDEGGRKQLHLDVAVDDIAVAEATRPA